MQYQNPFGTTGTLVPYMNGNPSTGIEGSIIPALAIQEPQTEIINALAANGLIPTDGDLTQLAQSVGYWIGTFGGSANSLSTVLSPLPGSIHPGLIVAGLSSTSVPNNGPATLNVGVGGTIAVTRSDQTPFAGNEIAVPGQVLAFRYDGTAWRMISPYPSNFYVPFIPQSTFFVDLAGSDSNNGLTAGTACRTIAHMTSVIEPFNLGGQTVTIQLVTPGTYSELLTIVAPSNGTLVIRGNPSAQSTYAIAAVPTVAAQGVVNCEGGSVALTGLQIINTSPTGVGAVAQAVGGSMSLTNVTLAGLAVTNALLEASIGGSAAINGGVIFANSSGAAILATSGGQISQNANSTVSGSPTFTTAFAVSVGLGVIAQGGVGGWSWSGAASGSRFNTSNNGVILGTGNINFFPGSTPGTNNSGGEYS